MTLFSSLPLYGSAILEKLSRKPFVHNNASGGVMAFVLLLSAPVVIEQIGWKAESLNAYFLQNNNFLLFIACYWLIYQCEKKTFRNNMVNTLATGSLAIYLVTDYPDVRTMLTPWILPYLLKGYGAIMIAGICLVILLADQCDNIFLRF